MLHRMFTSLLVAGILTAACLGAPPVHAGGDPGLTGYNYAIGTKVLNQPQISWTHIAVNGTNLDDLIEYNVTRTKSFSGSTLVSAEASALTYKCQVAAEVSFGSSVTYSTKATYFIPAYSSVTCRFGSAMVRTTGNMEYWLNGRMMSSRYVSDNYSRASYSDKYYN